MKRIMIFLFFICSFQAKAQKSEVDSSKRFPFSIGLSVNSAFLKMKELSFVRPSLRLSYELGNKNIFSIYANYKTTPHNQYWPYVFFSNKYISIGLNYAFQIGRVFSAGPFFESGILLGFSNSYFYFYRTGLYSKFKIHRNFNLYSEITYGNESPFYPYSKFSIAAGFNYKPAFIKTFFNKTGISPGVFFGYSKSIESNRFNIDCTYPFYSLDNLNERFLLYNSIYSSTQGLSFQFKDFSYFDIGFSKSKNKNQFTYDSITRNLNIRHKNLFVEYKRPIFISGFASENSTVKPYCGLKVNYLANDLKFVESKFGFYSMNENSAHDTSKVLSFLLSPSVRFSKDQFSIELGVDLNFLSFINTKHEYFFWENFPQVSSDTAVSMKFWNGPGKIFEKGYYQNNVYLKFRFYLNNFNKRALHKKTFWSLKPDSVKNKRRSKNDSLNNIPEVSFALSTTIFPKQTSVLNKFSLNFRIAMQLPRFRKATIYGTYNQNELELKNSLITTHYYYRYSLGFKYQLLKYGAFSFNPLIEAGAISIKGEKSNFYKKGGLSLTYSAYKPFTLWSEFYFSNEIPQNKNFFGSIMFGVSYKPELNHSLFRNSIYMPAISFGMNNLLFINQYDLKNKNALWISGTNCQYLSINNNSPFLEFLMMRKNNSYFGLGFSYCDEDYGLAVSGSYVNLQMTVNRYNNYLLYKRSLLSKKSTFPIQPMWGVKLDFQTGRIFHYAEIEYQNVTHETFSDVVRFKNYSLMLLPSLRYCHSSFSIECGSNVNIGGYSRVKDVQTVSSGDVHYNSTNLINDPKANYLNDVFWHSVYLKLNLNLFSNKYVEK